MNSMIPFKKFQCNCNKYKINIILKNRPKKRTSRLCQSHHNSTGTPSCTSIGNPNCNIPSTDDLEFKSVGEGRYLFRVESNNQLQLISNFSIVLNHHFFLDDSVLSRVRHSELDFILHS